MGLDNGLIVRAKSLRAVKFLNENFSDIVDEYAFNSYELGYWRKCWNIRFQVLEAFSNKGYDGQGGDIHLTLSDLITFREIMKYFLIEENWDNDYGMFRNGSIWTWEEALRGIAHTIYWITEFLHEVELEELSDEDFEIFFYDSY